MHTHNLARTSGRWQKVRRRLKTRMLARSILKTHRQVCVPLRARASPIVLRNLTVMILAMRLGHCPIASSVYSLPTHTDHGACLIPATWLVWQLSQPVQYTVMGNVFVYSGMLDSTDLLGQVKTGTLIVVIERQLMSNNHERVCPPSRVAELHCARMLAVVRCASHCSRAHSPRPP